MLAATDFGPWVSLLVIAAIVVVSLIVRASRGQQAGSVTLAKRPAYRPQPLPQAHMARGTHPYLHTPNQDVDSDEAVEVAERLVPEFMQVANAQRLADIEAAAQPDTSRARFNLRDADEARRAIILNEVFGKPMALRKR